MLRNLNLVVWNSEYRLATEKPSIAGILEMPEFLEAIVNLSDTDTLEVRVYTLLVDADEDVSDDEMLDLIADNLPDMLADNTVVVSDYGEYTIKGIANRNLGLAQHITDCKRYYTTNPFL